MHEETGIEFVKDFKGFKAETSVGLEYEDGIINDLIEEQPEELTTYESV